MGRRLDRLAAFAVAHVVAVFSASTAFAGTVLLMALGDDPTCTVGCSASSSASVWHDVGAALLIVFIGVVASGPLLIPVTVLCFPMAIAVARATGSPWASAAVGAVAGPVIGLPLTMVLLGLSDRQGWTMTSWWEAYAGALHNLGPAAFFGGLGFAFSVGWFERRRIAVEGAVRHSRVNDVEDSA